MFASRVVVFIGSHTSSRRLDGNKRLFLIEPVSQPIKWDGVKHMRVKAELDEETLHPRSMIWMTKIRYCEDDDAEGGNHLIRVMRDTGRRKYTRVMKEEEGDGVDARFVKRGAEEEEEEGGKYARVMRKAKDTFSMGNLDGKIDTRRVEGKMDGNVFETMPVRNEATKYDQRTDIQEDMARNRIWMKTKEEKKFQRVRRTDRYTRVMKRFLRPMKKRDEVGFRNRQMVTRVG